MIPAPLAAALQVYVRHAPGSVGKPMLVRRWLNDHFRDRPVSTAARTRFGASIPVLTSDVIQRYLYLFGTWEPNLTAFVRSCLAPGDTFIDVGANIGYYTLLAAHLTGPTGRVVAVEPAADFHRALAEAVHANRYTATVRTVRAAASDTTHRMTLYRETPTNLGNTSLVRPSRIAASVETEAARLHQLVTPDELAAARLIKIDVEGAEAAAVRGLLPALPLLRADAEIIIEVTPRSLTKLGESVDAVTGPLAAHGFRAYRLLNDYDAASYPAALRSPSPPRRWHYPITEMGDFVFSQRDAAYLD